jgi:hypothetical protein
MNERTRSSSSKTRTVPSRVPAFPSAVRTVPVAAMVPRPTALRPDAPAESPAPAAGPRAAGRKLRADLGRGWSVEIPNTDAYGHLTRVSFDRFGGIDDQVHHHLLDLRRISSHEGQRGRHPRVKFDILGNRDSNQVRRGAHQPRQIEMPSGLRRFDRESNIRRARSRIWCTSSSCSRRAGSLSQFVPAISACRFRQAVSARLRGISGRSRLPLNRRGIVRIVPATGDTSFFAVGTGG